MTAVNPSGAGDPSPLYMLNVTGMVYFVNHVLYSLDSQIHVVRLASHTLPFARVTCPICSCLIALRSGFIGMKKTRVWSLPIFSHDHIIRTVGCMQRR